MIDAIWTADWTSLVLLGVLSLPGIGALDPALSEKLEKARDVERRAGSAPHTEHRTSDGTPKYTNRLILENSPYLRQHAHNPVDWYAWGEEAFAAARAQRKPIFLSIGYSTCHWCHVMARESFEDERTAAVMNTRCINVKVDREERPDVDSLYMTAVQLFTGSGGWPMSVWLTPEGQPFHGGTYFPPAARWGRPGFTEIVTQLADLYERSPTDVSGRAGAVADRIRLHAGLEAVSGSLPEADRLHQAAQTWARIFDAEWGGFGAAPKFPKAMEIDFLLRYHRRAGDAKVLPLVTLTLDRMAEGGIYDHLGGGFARYATDEEWHIPHFEKMLYDNALLATAYADAWIATGRSAYARVTRETLDYLLREMQDPAGGFYSATDADSEGEEGRFFVWTPAEIESALGRESAREFNAFYGVTSEGHFEGRNVLRLRRGSLPETLPPSITRARATLLAARERRIHPHLDDKVLTSWNGLTISALARAGFSLGEPRYLESARRAARFVLDQLQRDGRLLRSWRKGKAGHPAYLTDYANLIAGLLDLFETTQDRRWLTEAKQLQTIQDALFLDPDSGCWFFTASDHESLMAREVPTHDNARPSGNSVAMLNLQRLAALGGQEGWMDRVRQGMASLASRLEGSLSPRWLSALEMLYDSPKEIVLVGPNPGPFFEVLRRVYLPNKVVMAVSAAEAADPSVIAQLPLIEHKTTPEGSTTAYVCVGRVCREPTASPEIFAVQLGAVTPLPTPSGG